MKEIAFIYLIISYSKSAIQPVSTGVHNAYIYLSKSRYFPEKRTVRKIQTILLKIPDMLFFYTFFPMQCPDCIFCHIVGF